MQIHYRVNKWMQPVASDCDPQYLAVNVRVPF